MTTVREMPPAESATFDVNRIPEAMNVSDGTLARGFGTQQEHTALRAYDKWVARGRPSGTESQDWQEAEAEAQQLRDLARQLAELEGRLTCQIAGRRQAERRLTAEHAVNRILAVSRTLIDAAPGIIRALCESLCWDVGEIWVVDRSSSVLRCVEAWQSPDVDVSAFLQDARHRTFSRGVGIPGRIWGGEATIWVPDITLDANLPRAAIASRDGLHGAVGFPIRGETELLGVIDFFSREVRQPDEELIDMMTTIGSQISQFIERKLAEDELRRQEEERRIAREIQQGLLPKFIPTIPGFTIHAKLSTAHDVGGDCFDLLPFVVDGKEYLIVLVADASGHGIGAALLAAETRAYVRALALACADVGMLLTLTNRRLAEGMVSGHFVTLLLVQIDPRARSLVYASAGHCPGYVLDRHGRIKAVLPSTGIPLGIDPTGEFATGSTIALESGERVFLYSDGIVEACSPEDELFGIKRTLGVVGAHRHETPDNILAALFDAVGDFSKHASLDDMTAVIIQAEEDA
jgi:serine phosphatase RsbU (regulator of sigma subunit)